uniref:Uncharacterized protein n=1 Tax=Chrysemys picta bellii TaxID=8478 RepID=A0A8C3HFH3_CHRPI
MQSVGRDGAPLPALLQYHRAVDVNLVTDGVSRGEQLDCSTFSREASSDLTTARHLFPPRQCQWNQIDRGLNFQNTNSSLCIIGANSYLILIDSPTCLPSWAWARRLSVDCPFPMPLSAPLSF